LTSPTDAAQQLLLEHITIRDVRNLAHVEIDPAPRLNVIAGNNGQGKTSILESLYLLGTSRSFRTSKLPELVRHGASCASVRGAFSERSGDRQTTVRRSQSAGLEGGRRVLRIDEEPPASLAHYATRSPLVVFDPSQMTLSTGPASGRRLLLDRVTLFTDVGLATHRSRYNRALKARQQLLAPFGPPPGAHELTAFEALLARHGAAITAARALASEQLTRELCGAFERIAQPGLVLEARYCPGGSADEAQALQELASRRSGDARRRRAGFGPHLDDLDIRIDGHPARTVGSQGQHRAITLALKMAELACIASARNLLPMFLLDDVSSELDPDRSQALLDYLATVRCQIFLTTTRRDLVVAPSVEGTERLDLWVQDGGVQAAPSR
jgi:DNA replication and repair protein RecF